MAQAGLLEKLSRPPRIFSTSYLSWLSLLPRRLIMECVEAPPQHAAQAEGGARGGVTGGMVQTEIPCP